MQSHLAVSCDINCFLLQIYNEDEMLKAKLELLSNTNMVDFAMDVHQGLYPGKDVPTSKSYYNHLSLVIYYCIF